jgi:hypothetical protein
VLGEPHLQRAGEATCRKLDQVRKALLVSAFDSVGSILTNPPDVAVGGLAARNARSWLASLALPAAALCLDSQPGSDYDSHLET